ncbi:hypothetical protein GCM10007315_28880 [Gemmobacter tilapiae]|uniref:Uncharacterized protein n=1 Tax=Neogemmobacter tilapiae TaxID=875041 RepID=A0A918TX54_9RHOB|nr:hypothetical protein GCM10007315_28880 [Gemmobacter tilapiae]
MIKDAASARGQGIGAGVGPAIAGGDDAHAVEAEVEHGAGGGTDVLAHLGADKDEMGLVEGALLHGKGC